MELYIVRHGIAIDRSDPKCPPEPKRYLTDEGVEKTKQIAKGVVESGATVDVMFSSPYLRAMQTAEIFAHAFDYPKEKIRQTEALLSGAEPGIFFRELAKEKQSLNAFCFGHAPHLDELIAVGLGLKHAITSLKKAGVALLELKHISPPRGELIWMGTPRMLKRLGK